MKLRNNSWLAASAILLSLVFPACSNIPDGTAEELKAMGDRAFENAKNDPDRYNFEKIENECREGAKLYRAAADKGDPEAQYTVAGFYYFGHFFDKNYKKALGCFNKLTANPKASAELRLKAKAQAGEMHLNGLGVKRDPEKGLAMMAEAAEEGEFFTQIKLGTYYFDNGRPEDYAKAFYWFSKAAEAELKATDDPKYEELMKKGQNQARFLLGLMYFKGAGTPENKAKAFQEFKKASDSGSSDAEAVVGLMYLYGEGEKKDLEKGFKILKNAASCSEKAKKLCDWYLMSRDREHFPDIFLILTDTKRS